MNETTRRQFLGIGLFGTAALWCRGVWATDASALPFQTRGVVLIPEDLSLGDWPQRAKQAGLSTIGIHGFSPKALANWSKADAGQRFLTECRNLKLEVEYELHALSELLPRDLFKKEPELFRMNDKSERTPDGNCCVHSRRGLDLIAESVVENAKVLRSTTGRYFYWADDGHPWCSCPKCRDLSPSEQALVVENRIFQALRNLDSTAQLAHLAYANALQPPKQIKPSEGIFLEYAPIHRRYDIPYSQQESSKQDGLDALDANLEVFPRHTAQALEYWLDVSRFSEWKRPSAKVPWQKEVFLADIETYRQRGIRHITTFAVWIDADYKQRFGDLDFITEYGNGLSGQ